MRHDHVWRQRNVSRLPHTAMACADTGNGMGVVGDMTDGC